MNNQEYQSSLKTLLGIIRNSELWRLFRCRDKRHAFATHQLQSGLPVQDLQHYLGHSSLRTTLGYLHWIPNYHQSAGQCDLIAELPPAKEVRHD